MTPDVLRVALGLIAAGVAWLALAFLVRKVLGQ